MADVVMDCSLKSQLDQEQLDVLLIGSKIGNDSSLIKHTSVQRDLLDFADLLLSLLAAISNVRVKTKEDCSQVGQTD